MLINEPLSARLLESADKDTKKRAYKMEKKSFLFCFVCDLPYLCT